MLPGFALTAAIASLCDSKVDGGMVDMYWNPCCSWRTRLANDVAPDILGSLMTINEPLGALRVLDNAVSHHAYRPSMMAVENNLVVAVENNLSFKTKYHDQGFAGPSRSVSQKRVEWSPSQNCSVRKPKHGMSLTSGAPCADTGKQNTSGVCTDARKPSFLDDFILDTNKKLGEGASGKVFVCTRTSDLKVFAAKVMPLECNPGKEIAMHRRCLEAAPNGVVNIIAVYENEDISSHYHAFDDCHVSIMVLELMKDGDVFSFIERGGPMSEKISAQIVLSIAGTLKLIHGCGISHRDIKPENIMLVISEQSNGVRVYSAKITDFGFSAHGNRLSTPLGTAYYVAPEIIMADRSSKTPGGKVVYYNEMCDMWSLGVCMFVFLCQHAPFNTGIRGLPVSRQMFDKIISGSWKFQPAKIWMTVSDQSKDVIRRLLSIDPSLRLTAKELASDKALLELAGFPLASASAEKTELVIETQASKFMKQCVIEAREADDTKTE